MPVYPGAPTNTPSGRDSARWWTALAIAVVAAIFFFLTTLGTPSVCHEVLTGTKALPTSTTLCGPPRLLDLLPVALVIALLLWPDLTELGITGVLTLKRRVQQQGERQAAVEASLVELQQSLAQVAMLSQGQGQAQATTTNVNNYYAPDQDDVRRGIDEKRGEGVTDETQGGSRTEDLELHASLSGTFLKEYAQLEPYIMSGGARRAPRWALERIEQVSPAQQARIDEWNHMFRPEIQALRQTRNVAVHEPQSVSTETLRGALRNTRELARILFQGLDL